ncbi:MAG: hypothetical protein IPJ20_17065 [Flammeovirgaceae bacterium]|nr:hypothetical protein [Flammeovirgaceae bacterium]
MLQEQLIADAELASIEKWFAKTYAFSEKSELEIQLIKLYKLHQLEERIKVVEHQTKTHWPN